MELSLNCLLPYAVTAVKAVVIAVIGYVVALVGRAVTEKVCNSFETLKKHGDFPRSAGNLVY